LYGRRGGRKAKKELEEQLRDEGTESA